MQRGELWWASLAKPRGSEPGFRRPVVIISSDSFNASHINTVLVAIITSNLRLAKAPGNILLNTKVSGLPRDSVINVSQLITLDKAFLLERISYLGSRHLAALEAGLRLVLEL